MTTQYYHTKNLEQITKLSTPHSKTVVIANNDPESQHYVIGEKTFSCTRLQLRKFALVQINPDHFEFAHFETYGCGRVIENFDLEWAFVATGKK